MGRLVRVLDATLDHALVIVVFRDSDAHVSSIMRIPESVQLDRA